MEIRPRLRAAPRWLDRANGTRRRAPTTVVLPTTAALDLPARFPLPSHQPIVLTRPPQHTRRPHQQTMTPGGTLSVRQRRADAYDDAVEAETRALGQTDEAKASIAALQAFAALTGEFKSRSPLGMQQLINSDAPRVVALDALISVADLGSDVALLLVLHQADAQLFSASLAVLLVTVVLRVLNGLSFYPLVDRPALYIYFLGVLLSVVEPPLGMDLIESTLKRSIVSRTKWGAGE